MRPRISNHNFDPERMLQKAIRGDYPQAAKRSDHREEEIAYWRDRCGLTPSTSEADAAAAAEALNAEPDDDERFLEMPLKARRSLIHNYLLSSHESDWLRGAYLCALAGLRLPAEDRAAYQDYEARLARWQRTQRMSARKTTAPATSSAQALADAEQQGALGL